MSVQTTDRDDDDRLRPRAATGKFPFNLYWTLESVEQFDRMLASKCTVYTFVVHFGKRGVPEDEVKRRYYEKRGKLL